jgi:hypothetical protein
VKKTVTGWVTINATQPDDLSVIFQAAFATHPWL